MLWYPIGHHHTTMLSMGLRMILQTFAIISQFDSINYSSSELSGKTDIPNCAHICDAADIHASWFFSSPDSDSNKWQGSSMEWPQGCTQHSLEPKISSVRGVVWVTMYLGCISALKILTLALFRLVPAICITWGTVNTTLMNLFMLNTRYVYFTQNLNIAKSLHHTK